MVSAEGWVYRIFTFRPLNKSSETAVFRQISNNSEETLYQRLEIVENGMDGPISGVLFPEIITSPSFRSPEHPAGMTFTGQDLHLPEQRAFERHTRTTTVDGIFREGTTSV